MKQTNNAIKFLMAQYRAVFKHAYLKGLVSAVVLTAGLTAGATANATVYTDFANLQTDITANADRNLEIDGSASSKLTIVDKASKDLSGTVTITSGTLGTHYLGASTDSITLTSDDFNLNINLSSDKADTDGLIITAGTSNTSKKANIDIGSLNVQKGTLALSIATSTNDSGSVVVSADSITVGSNTVVTQDNQKGFIKLGYDDGSNYDTPIGTGTVTLGTASDKGGSQSASTTTLNKSGVIQFLGDSGSANVSKVVFTGKLDGQGGLLDFSKGSGQLETFGTDVNADVTVGVTQISNVLLTDDTKTTDVDESLLQFTNGKITLDNNSTNASGGQILISKGILALEDNVIVTTDKTASGAGTVGHFLVDGSSNESTLRVDADILTSFLTADKIGSSQSKDIAGAVIVSDSGATLEINSDTVVDLYQMASGDSIKFATGNTVASGSIAVSGGQIKADKLAVSDYDSTISSALNLSTAVLVADELTLGSANYDGVTAITISGSKVTDKLDLQTSASEFTLTGQNILARDYYVRKDGENTATLNSEGVITGSDYNISGGAAVSLEVQSGKWHTTGQNISLGKSGTLLVTSKKAHDGTVSAGTTTGTILNNGNPTYLTIDGGILTIGNSSDKGEIKVSGSSGSDATLDLTQIDQLVLTSGSITVSGKAIEFTDFKNSVAASDFYSDAFKNKVGYGILKLNNDAFTKLVKQPVSTSGVTLTISGDGIVQVDSLSTGEIDVDRFISGAASSGGEVGFNGAGYLVVDGQIDLFDGNKTLDTNDEGTAADVEGINIGSGTIVAKSLKLTNYARKTEAEGSKTVEDSKLVSGTVELSKNFETNSSTLVMGDSTSNVTAKLLLNAGLNQAGTLSFGGSNHKLNLVGYTSSDVALDIQTGSWSDQALDILASGDGTQVTVGSNDLELIKQAKQQSDDTSTVYVSEFTADNFKATADAGNSNIVLTVNQQSHATFNTMQLDNANKVTINGQLTILGREVAAPAKGETADVAYVNPNTGNTASTTAGISLGSSTFNISGSSANLEFGTVATSALIDLDGNQTVGATSTYALTTGGINTTNFVVTKFGSITFNFADNLKMSADDVKFLTTNLLDTGSDKTAYLVLNNADFDIAPVSRDDGKLEYSWESIKPFVQVVGSQATTEKLMKSLISNIGSNESDFRGHYGAALVDTDQKKALTLAGPTGFHNAGDFGNKFVQDKNGNVLGVNFANDYVSLELDNGGEIGKITGTGAYTNEDENNLVVTGTGSTTIYDGVSAINNFVVENATTVHGDVSVNTLELTSTLNALGSNNNGQVKLNNGIVQSGAVLNAHNLTVIDDINTNDEDDTLLVLGAVNLTGDLTVSKDSALGILNGSVSSKNLTLDDTSAVFVGYTPAANAVDDPDSEDVDESKSYTGSLEVTGTTTLNGGYVVLDPEYQQTAILSSFNDLSGATTTNAGTLDGSVFVGRNSIQGIGVANRGELLENVAQYLNANNSLNEELGAILYLGDSFTIDHTSGSLILTNLSTSEFTEYYNKNNHADAADLGNTDKPTLVNTLFLGANTAILVDSQAAAKADTARSNTVAMIGFDANNKGTVVADGGQIIIDGDVRASTYQVFSNADIEYIDGSDYSVVTDSSAAHYDDNINITTENNFLVGVVAADGTVNLGINPEGRSIMHGASDPVYTTLVAYAKGYNGDNAEDESAKLYDGYTTGTGDNGATTQVKDYTYNNDVLQNAISTGNGADAEKTARLGVYGGAVQAAITAGATTYNAVSDRMGMGAQTGSVTFADNGQGAGLWVTPIYKSHDSDDFEAQGLGYGADMDLYGVALGGDYTLANGLRVGAAFNVGSGDADGQGAGNGVSNDFDYYGFTVYGGYTFDKLSIVGDISYTVVDNDVDANTGVGKLAASMDTSNLSVGVTGQYTFNLDAVDVTPHAGMRYTYIDMDDYSVKADGVEQAHYTADSMSIFSIPVGVTFSKDIVSGDWTIKPSFDLTLTANVGDDSIDGSVTWAGVDNLTTNLESEVIDSFTYGATLGVSAKSGNFSMGFGVNYTGASSADEYGVSANARFVF